MWILAGRLRDGEDVGGNLRAHVYLVDRLPCRLELVRADNGRWQTVLRCRIAGRSHRAVAVEYRCLNLDRGISDVDAHHEPVELRFGERIGALELVWVLRGDDEEARRKSMRRPIDRDLAFCHRLEQCGLRLRSGTVDLIDQQNLGKERTRVQDELAS